MESTGLCRTWPVRRGKRWELYLPRLADPSFRRPACAPQRSAYLDKLAEFRLRRMLILLRKVQEGNLHRKGRSCRGPALFRCNSSTLVWGLAVGSSAGQPSVSRCWALSWRVYFFPYRGRRGVLGTKYWPPPTRPPISDDGLDGRVHNILDILA